MELEEAKERLLELSRISEEGARLHPEDSEMFLTDKEALETAIAELHAMQNLLDEKNEEIDRLQKENEELKNIDLTTVYLKGVADEKERWRNNIRDLILKIDVDIERNKKHEIMYKEEMGISEYVCKMIAYMPETVKIILQNLLKEE